MYLLSKYKRCQLAAIFAFFMWPTVVMASSYDETAKSFLKTQLKYMYDNGARLSEIRSQVKDLLIKYQSKIKEIQSSSLLSNVEKNDKIIDLENEFNAIPEVLALEISNTSWGREWLFVMPTLDGTMSRFEDKYRVNLDKKHVLDLVSKSVVSSNRALSTGSYCEIDFNLGTIAAPEDDSRLVSKKGSLTLILHITMGTIDLTNFSIQAVASDYSNLDKRLIIERVFPILANTKKVSQTGTEITFMVKGSGVMDEVIGSWGVPIQKGFLFPSAMPKNQIVNVVEEMLSSCKVPY